MKTSCLSLLIAVVFAFSPLFAVEPTSAPDAAANATPIPIGQPIFSAKKASATAAQEAQAQSAAESWLALADAGKWAETWSAASGYFQANAKQEQWAQMAEGVRKPLGALLSRKLKSATHAKTLPGAPDGEYVVLQFETSFENKREAIETVTPMKEQDGTWKVSGYFIK